jgi:hypothetical protein
MVCTGGHEDERTAGSPTTSIGLMVISNDPNSGTEDIEASRTSPVIIVLVIASWVLTVAQ